MFLEQTPFRPSLRLGALFVRAPWNGIAHGRHPSLDPLPYSVHAAPPRDEGYECSGDTSQRVRPKDGYVLERLKKMAEKGMSPFRERLTASIFFN